MDLSIMAIYTQELNTNYNFPHIDIYNRLTDGVVTGYQARTHEGYVMYNSTANDTEPDFENGGEKPVTYYYRLAGFPLRYNFDNFPWVAVPEDEVDENYIFGGGGTVKPEIM